MVIIPPSAARGRTPRFNILIIAARPARRGSSGGRCDAASSTGRNLAQVATPAPLGGIMKFLIINLMLTKTEKAL
jgi:hypothetical protein